MLSFPAVHLDFHSRKYSSRSRSKRNGPTEFEISSIWDTLWELSTDVKQQRYTTRRQTSQYNMAGELRLSSLYYHDNYELIT